MCVMRGGGGGFVKMSFWNWYNKINATTLHITLIYARRAENSCGYLNMYIVFWFILSPNDVCVFVCLICLFRVSRI